MWPSRSRLPASVRDLDHDRVVAALMSTNVNITAAARKLHVPTSDLRHLVYVVPELLSLAIDKEERRLDRAEEILDRELSSDDPRYSAAAAFFCLRNARRAAQRGWRQPDVEVVINDNRPPSSVNIRWGDGTHVATMMLPAGAHIPWPIEIEHDDSEPVVEDKPGVIEPT
jgi:hypothetical protein